MQMNRLNIIAIGALLLLVVGLFAMNTRTTEKIQSSFLGLLSPFLKTGSSLERRVTSFRQGLASLEDLERDNARLLVQNKELKAINQTLRDLEEENKRLRSALEYKERSVFELIPARVIARDSSTWWSTVQINRGSNHGIQRDMPVLTDKGLVGKTTTVASNSATVLLIADERCKVAARIEGSPAQGIVQGQRTTSRSMPLLELMFLSKDADLKPGQRVYTSELGGVFPAGVLIGAIKEFKVRELDGHATVVPEVDLTTLEDVFVVAGKEE